MWSLSNLFKQFNTKKLLTITYSFLIFIWIWFTAFFSWGSFDVKEKTILPSWVMIGDEFSWCFEKFCWQNRETFFISVEQKFKEDLKAWLHNQKITEKNKCDEFHISSIAYWFASVEHGNGYSYLAQKTNNITSLKQSSFGNQYIWEKEYGKFKNYLVYPNKFLAVLDFMHVYKYWFSCYLWQRRVLHYKLWKWESVENPAFKRYYKNLTKYVAYFENKHF